VSVLLLCSVVGAAAWPAPDLATPAEGVASALADARRLDPETARNTRYFFAGHLPAAERAELLAVANAHVNFLSTGPTIERVRRVTAWLWAVDARNYRWSLDVYGRLAYEPGTVEPYFHVEPVDPKTGKVSRPLIPMPGVANSEHAALIEVTESSIPIARADWFFNRTAVVEGRKGHSYYDFLGLKSRADAEKLAGLDRRRAIDIFRELAAIVPVSGVSPQGRQLAAYATVGGRWWETRDTKADKAGRGERNPVRNLLDDYKHDAEEIVATLPNRLPFFYLSDAEGKQIDSAPPDIASDHRSGNNDRRVHPYLSCVRCHESAGLIPFSDHARKVYGAGSGLSLGITDPAKFQRIKSAYLGPIDRTFKADVDEYTEAIKEACGLTPKELASAYARQWSRYADEPVTLKRLGDELGLSEKQLDGRLKAAAKASAIIDPVLAGYLAIPPIPARREQVEELFPLLMTVLPYGEDEGP
jgi:hypothetical protein